MKFGRWPLATVLAAFLVVEAFYLPLHLNSEDHGGHHHQDEPHDHDHDHEHDSVADHQRDLIQVPDVTLDLQPIEVVLEIVDVTLLSVIWTHPDALPAESPPEDPPPSRAPPAF